MAFVWKGCIRHTMSQWEEILTLPLGTSIVIDNKLHQVRAGGARVFVVVVNEC